MISLWGMKPADQAFGNEKNLQGESLPITPEGFGLGLGFTGKR